MPGSVLTLNTGSSGLKFALFDSALRPLLRGAVDDIEQAPCLSASDASGRAVIAGHRLKVTGAEMIVGELLDFAQAYSGASGLGCVGHRIVHGGPDYAAPVRITPDVLAALGRVIPLDPLHMPNSLATAQAIAASHPALPQVACFDTAFHHDLPAEAQIVAVPREYRNAGLRRYGFHGLSYEHIAGHLRRAAPELAQGRVIVAHLGSGASLCAMRGGVSISTTMGFSVLDGLVMATRCGTIDPGVILWLARQGHSFAGIEEMLYHRSGLLGVSGISGDMRVLLNSDDPRAAEAIDFFTYRIAVEAGGLASALGGIDGLIFTGGIGQHSSAIRARVCRRLEWLGLRLDSTANAAGTARISSADSALDVRVIAADEEMIIAQHSLTIIGT